MNDSLLSKRFVALCFCILSCLDLFGTAFVVVNTNDAGEGSFRQAILDANGNAGTDQIVFDVAGDGPHTFFPIPSLPVVTDTVLIDGYSQRLSRQNTSTNGNNASLRIRLVFASDALRIAASNCTVRGLAIIRGGSFAAGNGIAIALGSSNAVEGCFVGMDTDGVSVPLPGGGYGIQLSADTVGNTIGGKTPASQNLISGNISGIRLDGFQNVVEGNYIGSDRSGASAGTNLTAGIEVSGRSNIIGGDLPGTGNVISGNRFGITDASSSRGTLIRGNLIGTDKTGTRKLPNRASGIWLGLAQQTIVGGTARGAGNVISGNLEDGIVFNSALAFSNVVQGNLIGTDVGGTLDLGNGRNGVMSITWYHEIGGITPGAANTIAFNGGYGITATMGPNLISGNSIFANGGRGIQSYFPESSFLVLNLASITTTGLVVSGAMNASPNSAYRVEAFCNSECDPSGRGEGKTFLGWIDVVTDATGHADWTAPLPFPTPGEYLLTATATSANKNTSEFSACLGIPIPRLTILQMAGGEMVVSWPHSSPGFTLQFTDLLSHFGQWHSVGSGILSNDSGWSLLERNTLGSASRYFRLVYP